MWRPWSIRAGGWLWPSKFFHGFLASAEPQDIINYINKLRKEAGELQKQITEIVLYSEGAFRWNELWNMSFSERELAVKLLNNYNQVKAGKQPSDYL